MDELAWADIITVSILLVGIVGAFFRMESRIKANDASHEVIKESLDTVTDKVDNLDKGIGKIHTSVAVIINEQKNIGERIGKLEA